MIGLSVLASKLLRLIFVSIPVPIVAFLGLWIWVEFDKSSAVRLAISELVAGQQLAGKAAEIRTLRKIAAARQANADEIARRAQVARDAVEQFQNQLIASQQENQDIANELSILASRPVNDACVVDDGFYERLRNK